MSPTLLQIDFPFTGPWGEQMATALDGLAADIAAAPGLRWKIWTENEGDGIAGGLYLFDDRESAQAYTTMHLARIEGLGISGARALLLDVNAPLTATTRGPIG